MSDNNGQVVNEFGSKVSANVAVDDGLNQQGKETTLDDILAAVRGKTETQLPKADTTPAAEPVATDPVADAAKLDFNTGNKALDVAVSSFVKSTGATDEDIQRAVRNAIDYDDVSLIDKAFIQERFKDRAEEALAIAEAVLEQSKVAKTALVNSVYEAAGGQENWQNSLQVYKEHAPKGLQKVLQMMFDSGDADSVKEAAGMVVEYAKGSGVLSQVTQSRQTAGAGQQDASGLSRAEFQAAIGKLNQGSRTYAQDYARLIELRRIGTQVGK